MATTKNLSELIDREMGKGQGPFLVRICQDAGLLPKAKRGGWRSMEQLTVDHLADFIIAIAGTRAVGERNANSARAAVEQFSPLTHDWGEGHGARSLREDIANMLRQYRDKFEIGEDLYCSWILFVSDEHCPEVEIRLSPLDPDDTEETVVRYIVPETDAEVRPVRAAVIIGSELFSELALLLREDVPEEAPA